MENEKNDKNHVHFSEDTDEVGHTEIILKIKSPHFIEAHVGFLQVYHKYYIVLKIPLTSIKNLPRIKETDVPGAGVKVISIMKSEGTCEIHLHFNAYKEKLLKEKFSLLDSDGKDVNITVFARVLGKGKGTPMLRENVTCIGVEHAEDESEMSDWQGFK